MRVKVRVLGDVWVLPLGPLRQYGCITHLYRLPFGDIMTESQQWNVPALSSLFPYWIIHPGPHDINDLCIRKQNPIHSTYSSLQAAHMESSYSPTHSLLFLVIVLRSFSQIQSVVVMALDGAVSQTLGYGSIDGLVRDSRGNWAIGWLIGFHKAVGILDAFHAELWAILSGL
ncbi:hypothetical protein V6N13_012939 [Hibiscus sabdariffa]